MYIGYDNLLNCFNLPTLVNRLHYLKLCCFIQNNCTFTNAGRVQNLLEIAWKAQKHTTKHTYLIMSICTNLNDQQVLKHILYMYTLPSLVGTESLLWVSPLWSDPFNWETPYFYNEDTPLNHLIQNYTDTEGVDGGKEAKLTDNRIRGAKRGGLQFALFVLRGSFSTPSAVVHVAVLVLCTDVSIINVWSLSTCTEFHGMWQEVATRDRTVYLITKL